MMGDSVDGPTDARIWLAMANGFMAGLTRFRIERTDLAQEAA